MIDRQEEEAKYQGRAFIYENSVSNRWELMLWRLMDFTSRLGGKSYVGMPRNPITFATAKGYMPIFEAHYNFLLLVTKEKIPQPRNLATRLAYRASWLIASSLSRFCRSEIAR